MLNLVRYGFLGLAIWSCICGARASNAVHATSSRDAVTTTTAQAVRPASNSTGISSCSSRTVNYITHTLAQQCLRTDWSRSRGNTTSTLSSGTTESTTRTTTITTTSTSTVAVESETIQDAEQDSPLDNANFLSFEDWKKQNLAKVGQSGDTFGARQHDRPQRAPNVNALDSLGEESEIDIDFTGFGGAVVPDHSREQASPSASTDSTEVGQVSPAAQAMRPRDAGKTCKQRTNYASFDCAATVLKSNPECKSASSVLVENKDSYMLNKCSADDKHFIVELCNDILIDTVVLANYEFFSSIFRTFRVSVSDRYPAKAEKWKNLGTFEARNTREVQAFLIETPLIWARYLRIEFLTHYGSEYYCPVSLLRVHGTTMMEEFRNQEELARGEAQDEDIIETNEETVSAVTTAGPSAIQPTETPPEETLIEKLEELPSKVNSDTSSQPALPVVVSSTSWSEGTTSTLVAHSVTTVAELSTKATTLAAVAMVTTISTTKQTEVKQSSCPSDMSPTVSHSHPASTYNTSEVSSKASPTLIVSQTSITSNSSATVAAVSTPADFLDTTDSTLSSPESTQNTTTVAESTRKNATAPISVNSTVSTPKESTSKETISKTANSNSTKAATSSAQQAQPSTQESFFKSISKRLQQLESNSTLSLQYIEEQSRILRDAFSKVEKRQISTTANFLANLNNTVMAELAGFRQAYDQLWQSTVIELEGQQEQHHREMTALSGRMALVVDELVWQKRMGIVQSTLLLLCLGLVLFARGNSSVDASLLQQVMARSQAAFRSGPGSNENSPASGRSPVSIIRRKIWRTDAGSVLETVDDMSPADSPGLPPSLDEEIAEASDDETDEVASITALDDLTRAVSA